MAFDAVIRLQHDALSINSNGLGVNVVATNRSDAELGDNIRRHTRGPECPQQLLGCGLDQEAREHEQ